MPHDQDLFGKTYEQQLEVAGQDIASRDITPNRRIAAEIVLEPMGTGVRVTARDDKHKVLWGYVGSKENIKKIHCLVATYDTLQQLVAEELEKRGFLVSEVADPVETARHALDSLEETIGWLRSGLDVQKVSDATRERARIIARMATDANRQITLEAGTLKGMKSKAGAEKADESE